MDLLNAALQDDSIRNIALTGRYGVGKSSVLQEFARPKGERVLFLSLSTLGPDNDSETLTNQIEKELVKQLLYREQPSRLPQSRYQRIDRMPSWRSVSESAGGLIVLGIALWLFGVFPDIPGLSGDHPKWMGIGAAVIVVTAAICLLSWLRRIVHNRLTVSEVSAGGASISLDESESYFDEYLDEIVYFFEAMRNVDIVVFEDLDRFDDPGIFEALRELNTLLNTSKQTQSRVIRFVYALRDSIFEQLGHDAASQQEDAASSEIVRANRTKFFDLVIPIVPFITHRTSRDLLTQLVAELPADMVIGPDLIDLTARFLPDMRLLTNIVNEYSVYAKRLIVDKHGIEPLNPNKLFALLVYKNIHLADFEHMQRGRSDLDTVYRLSRELIAESLTVRRERLRRIADATALREAMAERATEWAEQLEWFFRKVFEQRDPQTSVTTYHIGDASFSHDEMSTERFWRTLFESNQGVAVRFRNPNGYPQSLTVTATISDLRRLFSDTLRIDDWDAAELTALQREEESLRAELEILRAADFQDLVSHPEFTVTGDDGPVPFHVVLERHIRSEIGRALIGAGFIDRHYTLYVAQYYGDRVPPNAMSFIVHHVDTNTPDFNYPLDNEDIAAILRETKRSFLSDVSAYNICLLDHLLRCADPGAETILNSLITRSSDTEQNFLQAYLTEGTQTTDATARLAAQWPAVFTQLIDNTDLPHEKRLELVDAALAHSTNDIDYHASESIREYFQNRYQSLPTLTASLPDSDASSLPVPSPASQTPMDAQIRSAVTTMTRAGFICDDLSVLNPTALRAIVESDHYALTATNLRAALGDPGPLSLDRIRSLDSEVYDDVIDRPGDYHQAVEHDTTSPAQATFTSATGEVTHGTPWTVESPDAFADVVTDLANSPTEGIAAVIRRAHPDCVIEELSTVPDITWESLALYRRFPATLFNIAAYITHKGAVDTGLAALLTSAGSIIVPTVDDDEDFPEDELEETKNQVAKTILGASGEIPDPSIRVTLVESLDLPEFLPPDSVRPEHGSLLGLLIRERILDDEIGLFKQFDLTDWDTLRNGVLQSTNFAEFVIPELLTPNTTRRLLEDPDIPTNVKHAILERFDEFIPPDNSRALSAAGQAALATHAPLGADRITTIASGTQNTSLVVRLLDHFDGTLTTDQILTALTALPSPYSKLTTSGERLRFPVDDHNTAVLTRLKADDRVVTRVYRGTGTRPARIDVTVK